MELCFNSTYNISAHLQYISNRDLCYLLKKFKNSFLLYHLTCNFGFNCAVVFPYSCVFCLEIYLYLSIRKINKNSHDDYNKGQRKVLTKKGRTKK